MQNNTSIHSTTTRPISRWLGRLLAATTLAFITACGGGGGGGPTQVAPEGQAQFTRQPDGSLAYTVTGANSAGQSLLTTQMNNLLAALAAQSAPAATDDDRGVLVAAWLPRMRLVGWNASTPQPVTNYYLELIYTDPQTGQTITVSKSPLDMPGAYTSLIEPAQAKVPRWEYLQMRARYGSSESQWRTEWRELATGSAIEAQRRDLSAAVATGGAIAQAALDAFNLRYPQDPARAARVIDENLTDPIAMDAARSAATHQWLTVLAVHMAGATPTLVDLPEPLPTSIDSLQGIGTPTVARLDADDDGYKEATQWLAQGTAILGIDRDGNGLIDKASELFSAALVPVDQRGLSSLRHFDSNGDGVINASDAAWSRLRLWIDTNGNARATASETFTLQQVPAGALTASATSVQSIDLQTQTIHLANGGTLRLTPLRVQAQLQGVKLFLHESNSNLSVFHEDGRTENHIISVMQAP